MWENDFKVSFSEDDFGMGSGDENKGEKKTSLDSGSWENLVTKDKPESIKSVDNTKATKEAIKEEDNLSANAFSSMAKQWITVEDGDLDMESEDKVSLEIIKNMKKKRKKKKQFMVWVFSLLGILMIWGVWLALVNNKDMLASLFVKKEIVDKEKKEVTEKEHTLVAVETTDEKDDQPIVEIVDYKEDIMPIHWIVKLDESFLVTPDMLSFYEKYKKDFRYIKGYETGDKVKEHYLRRLNLLMYDWKQKWLGLDIIKQGYKKVMPSFQLKAAEYEEWKEKRDKILEARMIEEEQPIEVWTGTIEEEQPIEVWTGTIEEEQPIEVWTGTIEEEQPIEVWTGTIEEEQPIEVWTGTIEEEQPSDILPWDEDLDELEELEEITLPWETGTWDTE